MPLYKILIVDDEPEALENCRRMLAGQRYECLVESDPRRALDMIERNHPQLLLTDLRMPGLDGIRLLQSVKRLDPTIKVVLLTAYASVQTAVLSMRYGAFDYLAKPFTGKELHRTIERALAGESFDSCGTETAWSAPFCRRETTFVAEPILLGHSPAVQALRAVIELVGNTHASVLLSGERGVGKERIARVIHSGSPRQHNSFVPADCLASEEAAVERELFGVDQAPRLTGSRAGLMESAHGGTLFLDEVGGLSLRLQAKVLRMLKERRGRRANGTAFFELDTRVIASSTRDLGRACSTGEFREDLYQYLNIVPIAVPSLRQRPEDIQALSRAFMEPLWLRKHRRVPATFGCTAEALSKLSRHTWPGNVRELQHVVERAAILADGPIIETHHLPDAIRSL